MLQSYASANTWDLLDGDALDFLQGEVGVAGVACHAVLGPAIRLRRNGAHPRVLRTYGGTCFKPELHRYNSTRLKPQLADGLLALHYVDGVVERCRTLNLLVRLVVCATVQPNTAQRHPEFATKNVFGDASHLRLCPHNPDVRSYLQSLIAELVERYRPDSIMVHALEARWSEADGDSVLPISVQSAKLARALLGVCMCESCRQGADAADVDVAAAARSITVSFDRLLGDSEFVLTMSDLRATDPLLAAYVNWQQRDRQQILNTLVDAAIGCPILVDAGSFPDMSVAELSQGTPRLGIVSSISECEKMSSSMAAAAQDLEVCVPARFLEDLAPDEVLAKVVPVTDLPLAGLTFDNFGAVSAKGRTALRQCVRYIRRAKGA